MRGRRRVGKSFLLDGAFEGRRWVYFQADEGEERGHLDFLAAEAAAIAGGAPLIFEDWNTALRFFGQRATERPVTVVLDEFQWMLKAQPLLDSIIMRHFDEWKRRKIPLTLVISGSALSLMEQLLESDRPMYGRADYRPLIEPFDFRDASEFGPPGASAEQKLLRYGILGGTAQYQVWAGRLPVRQFLKERILTKGEPLFEEPLQLIRGEDEIREPGNYYEILRAVAQGETQFAEIHNQLKASSTPLLTKRLKRLADLRYLGERRTTGGNGTTIWALSDPFFRFWFRYVYPNRSRLQRGRVEETCDAILDDLANYMGPVFESVCRDWAGRYARTDQFPDAEEIGAYWTRKHDVEIDVVARSRGRYLALGSCKWSKGADAHVLDELIEAGAAVRGAAAAKLFIFSRGFHSSLVERAQRGEVQLISAEQLFD
jgi:hypothetical protein